MQHQPAKSKTGRRLKQARWIGGLTPLLGASGVVTHGLAAVVGLALGIVCLRIVRAYGGSMRDMDGVMMGVIVSGLVLMMGLIHAPIFAGLREKTRMGGCRRNVQSVARAIRVYSMNEGDRYPPASGWCDALVPRYLSDPARLRCPSAPGADCAYALNSNLSGARRRRPGEDALVMLFDGHGGWNASGGPALLAPRHGGGGWVVHTDGRTTWRRPGAAGRLRWRQSREP